ncbi:MAG TPA: OmpH family outer membrane protein [Stellaceae bacterium]|jgi:Skp family chaperone for outer membrane proteins|nr:OmpH family outer membrane protein [Stellaceae bacterium]
MSACFRRRAIGALVLLAAAALPALPLRAQSAPTLPPPVILIVDMQEILQDAKAAKEVQAILNKQYTAYSKEVAQQEDELQKGGTELERQRTVMAPDAYNQRARELQERYDELGKSVQARRAALQQSLSEAMGKVRTAALEVVADIVKERRANLVLEKEAVVFEPEGMDVTADAIRRLDQKLPSVPVNLPKLDDGAAKPPAGKPASGK